MVDQMQNKLFSQYIFTKRDFSILAFCFYLIGWKRFQYIFCVVVSFKWKFCAKSGSQRVYLSMIADWLINVKNLYNTYAILFAAKIILEPVTWPKTK